VLAPSPRSHPSRSAPPSSSGQLPLTLPHHHTVSHVINMLFVKYCRLCWCWALHLQATLLGAAHLLHLACPAITTDHHILLQHVHNISFHYISCRLCWCWPLHPQAAHLWSVPHSSSGMSLSLLVITLFICYITCYAALIPAGSAGAGPFTPKPPFWELPTFFIWPVPQIRTSHHRFLTVR
jgi:hypothetical protein